jgi:short-subunit dehydrogenase
MIIWITGASSGLGRELARQYVTLGHQVCVSARGEAALEELAASCGDAAGSIRIFPLDVTSIDQVKSCFENICATVGIPDISVLNAGTHMANSVEPFDATIFRRLMEINYMGVVNCLQSAVPAYIAQRKGHIAVVSSVAGYQGLPNASAYGASKAALINMCEALQPELAAAGVKLQLVNPGFVRTPLTDLNEFPMPFLMEVDAAAGRIIRGLESNRFEISFPRRFTWLLKMLQLLPYTVYLRLTRKLMNNA